MATPHDSRHVSPRRGIRATTIALAVVASVSLTGCFTGQRPTFDDSPPQELSGNAEIDAVLARLDSIQIARFTADYEVLTKLGNKTSVATVVQAEDSRRSITVNAVRFIFDGATVATCNLTAGNCEATINDARTSDLLLTHDFYANSAARRLRVDANRRIGDPNGFGITQGGQQALCVDVPVTGGTKRYCALESGALALYDGNDLHIALSDYSPIPDQTKFETN